MNTLKIVGEAGRKLALILVVAALLALLALMALTVSGNDNCVEGSDDYDQCVALARGVHNQEIEGHPTWRGVRNASLPEG